MSDLATKLTGLTVCVTRPAPDAEVLAESIREMQGQAVIMPVMAIVAVADARERIENIFRTDPDIIIFISRNAVRHCIPLLSSTAKQYLKKIKVAAIGASTEKILQEQGVLVSIRPDTQSYTTESLLQSPDLQCIKGLRIIIIRGRGGRASLAEKLQQRGADVMYCELYQRILPENFNQSKFSILHQSDHIMLCSSSEIMHNILELAGAKYGAIVKKTPLLVVSPRIHKEAIRLGFQSDILVSENASNQAVLRCLTQWYAVKEN
ncbi:hypothetical protein MNBD_GAMMA12-537 [hydrothermal vent metagenome]|uniref:uroporphyrinogen-III synthase n=1 Tax=hydrothermal vent metagenome TaxID=652676 RepID=A0A3B0YG66_9ZZZZ